VVTLLKLTPLVTLVGLGVWGAHLSGSTSASGGSTPNLIRAMLVVVFATQGFEIVAVPAGHVRRSRWSIPLATVLSLLLAALLYLALHAICVTAVANLEVQSQPLVAAADALGGAGLAQFVAIGTTVSAVGIAFGMFAMTPRYLATLGRDDGLGAWIGQEGERQVPARALVFTCCIVAGLVTLALGGSRGAGLRGLFVLSGVMVLTQYGVSALALGALAIRRQNGLDMRHLWPVPFVAATVLVMAQAARWGELLVAAGSLAVGILVLISRRAVVRR
jgi:amino acid efflux transporter